MVDINPVLIIAKGVGGIGVTHSVGGEVSTNDGTVIVGRVKDLHGIATKGIPGHQPVVAQHFHIVGVGGECLAVIVEGTDVDVIQVELARAELSHLLIIDINGIERAGIYDSNAVGGIQ